MMPTSRLLVLSLLIALSAMSGCSSDGNITDTDGDVEAAMEYENDEEMNETDSVELRSCDEPGCSIIGSYPGSVRTDKYGIQWMTIPKGCFCMGCSKGDRHCDDNEKPPHQVDINAFEMTVFEITQQQYKMKDEDHNSYHSDCPQCPVENIWSNEATEYCESVGGRLPSEAEWEYAARAGTAETVYYCGNNPNCLKKVAWYAENSNRQSQNVGLKNPNAFGLYDTIGNVREFTSDRWSSPDYIGQEAIVDGDECQDCYGIAIRGGGYLSGEYNLRVSRRLFVNDLFSEFGFRCARDIE